MCYIQYILARSSNKSVGKCKVLSFNGDPLCCFFKNENHRVAIYLICHAIHPFQVPCSGPQCAHRAVPPSPASVLEKRRYPTESSPFSFRPHGPRQPLVCLTLQIGLFATSDISGITQYVAPCDWLLWFCIIFFMVHLCCNVYW